MMHYFRRIDHERRPGSGDRGLAGAPAGPETSRIADSVTRRFATADARCKTELDIEALAYIRTPEDFVTSTHDLVDGVSMRWHVRFFNPASNLGKQSWLRVINASGIETEVVIEGRDDRGAPAPGGEVRIRLGG